MCGSTEIIRTFYIMIYIDVWEEIVFSNVFNNIYSNIFSKLKDICLDNILHFFNYCIVNILYMITSYTGLLLKVNLFSKRYIFKSITRKNTTEITT